MSYGVWILYWKKLKKTHFSSKIVISQMLMKEKTFAYANLCFESYSGPIYACVCVCVPCAHTDVRMFCWHWLLFWFFPSHINTCDDCTATASILVIHFRCGYFFVIPVRLISYLKLTEFLAILCFRQLFSFGWSSLLSERMPLLSLFLAFLPFFFIHSHS